jgi:hypothetical protein
MKTVQKLEIVFGLATFVGTLIYFCIMLRLIVGKRENDEIYREVFSLAIPTIIPGLMVGIGSVAHSVRKSSIGLNALLFGGTVLVLVFGLSFLGFAVWTGWLGAFLLSTPGLLAVVTMYFATRSRKI